MSSKDDDKSKTKENSILEILEEAGVSTTSLVSESHAFWDTQPMPAQDVKAELPEGPIVPNKTKTEIRSTPYNMPKGFEWSTIDIKDSDQRLELYTLLANNYVEDNDALFRFDYSQEFLQWALTPPGYTSDLLLGVRASSSNKLVAFISAVPANVKVQSTSKLDVVEINFLCVHKKLRAKRLAPVLIKEITRRSNQAGIFQAVYTAGVVLPVPVASARYYHRSLNPKKLVKVGFSRTSPRMTMARMIKLYKVANKPKHNFVGMKEIHVNGVHDLLETYLESNFALHANFTKEEIAHWLLPRDSVINTYVIVDEDDESKVTDMVSFYHLPSTILNEDESLYAAYSYYNVATTMTLSDLMRDALILANATGIDVYNALNLIDRKSVV